VRLSLKVFRMLMFRVLIDSRRILMALASQWLMHGKLSNNRARAGSDGSLVAKMANKEMLMLCLTPSSLSLKAHKAHKVTVDPMAHQVDLAVTENEVSSGDVLY